MQKMKNDGRKMNKTRTIENKMMHCTEGINWKLWHKTYIYDIAYTHIHIYYIQDCVVLSLNEKKPEYSKVFDLVRAFFRCFQENELYFFSKSVTFLHGLSIYPYWSIILWNTHTKWNEMERIVNKQRNKI